MVEKKLGAKMECSTCGAKLECKMSNYTSGFANKPQWQDEDGNKAHFDRNGNCKKTQTQISEVETTTAGTSSEPPKLPTLPVNLGSIDVPLETKRMITIRNQVETTVKDHIVDAHPGMIWEMTALIYKKYFGDKN